MKGRKPKPAETRRRQGNPGKRPLPEPARVSQRAVADEDGPTVAQLRVLDVQLPVPAHLETDDEAVEAWRTYGGMLASAGIIEISDQLALEALVEAEILARRAWRALEAERTAQLARDDGRQGVVVDGISGGQVRHPAVTVWKDARAQFLRFAEQLGLTPVARTRLGVLGLAGQKLQTEIEAALPPQPVRRKSA